MCRTTLIAALVCFALVGWVPAQQREQDKKKEEQPRIEDSSSRRDRQDTQRFERPIFLQGRVILDDGSRPPEQTEVELVCHGSVYRQVYVAPDGSFSFHISSTPFSQLSETPMDASVSPPLGGFGTDPMSRRGAGGGLDFPRGDLGSSQLSGCELRADLPGFQSEMINLGPRRPLDDPDVGVIVLHRLGEVRGTIVSANSLAAPKKARRSYEKAQEALEKKEPDFSKATKELENAVKEYPEFAAAWHRLGEIRWTQKDETGAQEAFHRAAGADPNFISPYLSLANIELQKNNWEQAAQLSRQVLGLNQYAVRAHYFNAVASYFLGELNSAEQSLLYVRQSSEARNYPGAHYLLGGVLASRGDLTGAATEFRQFLQISPEGPVADDLKGKLQEWESKGLIQRAENRESKK